jgi:hypothetical protein
VELELAAVGLGERLERVAGDQPGWIQVQQRGSAIG